VPFLARHVEAEAACPAGRTVLGLAVEPSAALGIAAILQDRDCFAGRPVVTIASGSNVDLDAHHLWVGAA
jgi:threonine dehydratase